MFLDGEIITNYNYKTGGFDKNCILSLFLIGKSKYQDVQTGFFCFLTVDRFPACNGFTRTDIARHGSPQEGTYILNHFTQMKQYYRHCNSIYLLLWCIKWVLCLLSVGFPCPYQNAMRFFCQEDSSYLDRIREKHRERWEGKSILYKMSLTIVIQNFWPD